MQSRTVPRSSTCFMPISICTIHFCSLMLTDEATNHRQRARICFSWNFFFFIRKKNTPTAKCQIKETLNLVDIEISLESVILWHCVYMFDEKKKSLIGIVRQYYSCQTHVPSSIYSIRQPHSHTHTHCTKIKEKRNCAKIIQLV